MHPCGHSNIKFCGHVTLRLRIHFSYQPNVSKTCSFINLCIHSSLFWVFGKTFTAFTLHVYTHFSKTGYDQLIFSKKSWKSSLFKSMLVFQPNNLFSFSFFFLLSFFYLLSFSSYLLLFFFFFFLSFAEERTT